MSSKGFTYAPIDTTLRDIRLLRLLDRHTPGPPSCEIFHASLSDDITYEALSYSWGDPKLQDSILLNGNITSVTVNLARALEDIRLDHRIRVLWVDALCINQENTTERNHQVKQMGAIYQKAERVVVWLGRPKSLGGVSTLSVLDFLDKFFDLGLEYSAYQPNLKAKWLELIALCELPYWHRLWIVQEIGLAADLHVYHGCSYKDWKTFSQIRKEVDGVKKQVTFHESLQGIAKTITESVPGRLDQQREFRQRPWLGEMRAAIKHLISRANTTASAVKILSEIWNFSRQHFRSHIHPTFNQHTHSPIKKSEFTKFGIENPLNNPFRLDSLHFSEEIVRFNRDSDLESTEYTSRKEIADLRDWEYDLRQDSLHFSGENARLLVIATLKAPNIRAGRELQTFLGFGNMISSRTHFTSQKRFCASSRMVAWEAPKTLAKTALWQYQASFHCSRIFQTRLITFRHISSMQELMSVKNIMKN